MADEFEGNDTRAPADGASWSLLGHASREKADAFLDEQASFIRLQKEHLHEQRLLLLSHLRWQRFDDRVKGALQIMLAAIGAAAVFAIAAAVWNASQADGLVVEAFSVPPSYAQAGVTGEVLAQDFTGKLVTITAFANQNSFSRSKDVSAEQKDEVRVEIPEIGISLAEAGRFLRDWLGHERHVTGNLRDMGNGKIALTVAAPGAAPVTVVGSDLAQLEQEAAERIFGILDPVNIVNYLSAHDRMNEALTAAAHFAQIAQTPVEKADSYALWCYTTGYSTGDLPLAMARCRVGLSIYPWLATLHVQFARFLLAAGDNEAALAQYRAILPLKEEAQMPAHRGANFLVIQGVAASKAAELVGDFQGAISSCAHTCNDAELLLSQAESAAREHDAPDALRLEEAALAAGDVYPDVDAELGYYIHAARGEWPEAREAAAAGATATMKRSAGGFAPRFLAISSATHFTPLLATAEAGAGQFAQARHDIGSTPLDCYDCVRARGEVDLAAGNHSGAAYWFARAVHAAPSIPFAYTEWGAMLLREGRYEDAIGKFKAANLKGPHFADPLEMWGEALMQENRSDLALAKFAEAEKYAPNWGRLHLEWGKALYYAGHKDDAKKQFVGAASLDLSQGEKGAVNAWLKLHG